MEKEIQENPLSFSPITEGLGFHPFSDGLPYAPVRKTPGSSSFPSALGTGAIAAGPPMLARISVPIAAPAAAKTPLSAALEAKPKAAAEATEAEEPSSERRGFGYVAKRVIAFLLDLGANSALCLGAFSFALWRQGVSPEQLLGPGVALLFAIFLFFFNWALVTSQEVAFGTSLGKRLLGLALRASPSSLFLRAFLFLPSFLLAGTGLAWALFDKRRRCWHDVATDVQPIEIARL